jgi:large subunit ribosomal protein L35
MFLQQVAQDKLLKASFMMLVILQGLAFCLAGLCLRDFLILCYWSKQMPKIKTNRGAAKRFRRTGNGGFKCGQSHRRHILTKKSTKRKRQLRSPATIHPSDVRMAARMMPYS